MKLRRREPAPPRETIITLIDVVFFLLVFFMLIGRMDATAPFEITPPEATSGADMPGGGATISIASDGALALDGVPLDEGILMDRISSAVSERPSVLIRLNAHHSTSLAQVLPLAEKIEALGAQNVVLVVTPPVP